MDARVIMAECDILKARWRLCVPLNEEVRSHSFRVMIFPVRCGTIEEQSRRAVRFKLYIWICWYRSFTTHRVLALASSR